MEIIVGFSRAKDKLKLGSTLIRLVEKRAFSHVYIKYQCPLTKVMLIAQASHGLVNLCNFDIFKVDNIIVEEYKMECSDSQFYNMITFINLNLGKPYSKLQLILIGIKKILHLELKTKNQSESYICSELAFRICQIFGVKYSGNSDYITPSDINKLVRIQYGKIE